MVEKVLDFRSYTTVCGDYSVHIMEELEKIGADGRLRVYVPLSEREVLKQSIEALASAGLVEVEGEGVEGDSYYVVLRKKS